MWLASTDDAIYFDNSCFATFDKNTKLKYFVFFECIDNKWFLVFESSNTAKFYKEIEIAAKHKVFKPKDVIKIADDLELKLYYIPRSLNKDNKTAILEYISNHTKR